jgi:hypothetical protein
VHVGPIGGPIAMFPSRPEIRFHALHICWTLISWRRVWFCVDLVGRYLSSQSPSAEPRSSGSLDAPVRSQLIGNSIDMNCGLSVPAIGDVSSACLTIHSQLAHTYNMCESQSAPPQMSSTTEFFKSWYIWPASLCSRNEAIHIMGSVVCNLNCKLRICSSQQSYSTDIVHLRLAHLQQSSNVQYKQCSIPNSASATVAKSSDPLVFAYLRTRRITRYVSQWCFVYMQPSTLHYIYCIIPTCASAAVVKATVQALFNSDLRMCSSR